MLIPLTSLSCKSNVAQCMWPRCWSCPIFVFVGIKVLAVIAIAVIVVVVVAVAVAVTFVVAVAIIVDDVDVLDGILKVLERLTKAGAM